MSTTSPSHIEISELISTDPATGEEIGRVHVSSADEVRATVERGRTAFEAWRNSPFKQRKALVMHVREIILAEMDDIALLLSKETGKPVAEAISMEMAPVLDLLQFFARNARRMLKTRRRSIGLYHLLGRTSTIVNVPYGVIGIIPAWNYPFSIPLAEAAMAVLAGNAVVIKPAELTPFVGLKIGELFDRAGAPEDLVQVVTGAGETGAALVEAAPDKIMFTGSVATGKRILSAASANMTPVVLELGGKDPMIVFEDANLDLAAGAAVWAAFCNAGQSCSSVERLYVQESVVAELTSRIVEKTKALGMGIGTDTDVSIGPMSSERQIRIVEQHVDEFRKAGARILTGGRRASEIGQLFYEPTVIAGATNDMRPMREETFGPTLPIATFRTEQEAIAFANDTEFGLTASVWTADHTRGKRVARQIVAGSVCINEVLYTHGIGQTPWGGFKNSGRGRTHGLEGLMEMVQSQHIHTNHFPYIPDPWWMPYSKNAGDTFRGIARKFASGSVLRTATIVPRLLDRIRELMKK